jgi:uncharacterized protein YkwD
MGLLACATAILLTGVVIGRVSAESDEADEVHLRRSSPTPSTAAKAVIEKARRNRPPLERVYRPQPPAGGKVPPVAHRSREPSTKIDGSGGGSQIQVIGPSTSGKDVGDGSREAYAGLESEVVTLVNAERAKKGCSPLREDRRLVRSARVHADEMARSNKFGHTFPNGNTPWARMAAAGYSDGGAEIIARGYETAEEVVRGWMAESTHRGTLLDCRLVVTGVGVSLGESGLWWTEDFGYS